MTIITITGVLILLALGYVFWDNIQISIQIADLKNKIDLTEAEVTKIKNKGIKKSVCDEIPIQPPESLMEKLSTVTTTGYIPSPITCVESDETEDRIVYMTPAVNDPAEPSQRPAEPVPEKAEQIPSQPVKVEGITELSCIIGHLSKQIKGRDEDIAKMEQAVATLQNQYVLSTEQNSELIKLVRQDLNKQPAAEQLLKDLSEQIYKTKDDIKTISDKVVENDVYFDKLTCQIETISTKINKVEKTANEAVTTAKEVKTVIETKPEPIKANPAPAHNPRPQHSGTRSSSFADVNVEHKLARKK